MHFIYRNNRLRANTARPKFLAVEPLEDRFMLDGDWTLISYQSELDDFGQVVSEVYDWDFTGDETADMQAVYRYTNDGIPGWPKVEITNDYGIDGILENHVFQWWTSSSEGPVDHLKSAFDSNGDGIFDRFHYDSMRLHRSEIQDYLDSSVVYYRSDMAFDANDLLQSIIEEFDENGDGELDRRVSTIYHWEAFDENSLLTSIVIETDEAADGSLDHRSMTTYEYSRDEFGSYLNSITTEIDDNGDGVLDSISVETIPPIDIIDDGTGIVGEDGGGDDSGGDGDEGTGEIDPGGEVEGDGIESDPGTPVETGSEVQSGGHDPSSGELESLSADASSGSDRSLADSVNWMAYQMSSAQTVDDLLSIDAERYTGAALPSIAIAPRAGEAESSDVVVQPERQPPKLNWTTVSVGPVVVDGSPRLSISTAPVTETKFAATATRLA